MSLILYAGLMQYHPADPKFCWESFNRSCKSGLHFSLLGNTTLSLSFRVSVDNMERPPRPNNIQTLTSLLKVQESISWMQEIARRTCLASIKSVAASLSSL